MYDSTVAADLPAGAPKYAGYVNGSWPSHDSIAARFPHARTYGIDVLGNAWLKACIVDWERFDVQDPQKLRTFITNRNHFEPETAVVYCQASNVDAVDEYADGLWHVLFVANWGMNGAVGKSMTGQRTKAGNLIVATQLQNNAKANWDMSDSLASW